MRIQSTDATPLFEPTDALDEPSPASISGNQTSPTSPQVSDPHAFRDYLKHSLAAAETEERTFDHTFARLRGPTLNMNELIAMQVGVYRFTQHIDLASRLVDKASGTAKQVLQSQT